MARLSPPPGAPTVLRHQPAVERAFFKLYAAFWRSPLVDAPMKEVLRLRNARVTNCGL